MVQWSEFTSSTAQVNGQRIAYRQAGTGPAILLLHGYPQTNHIWRFTAPTLAKTHTVVCADLRGYGRSSKPSGSETHVEYSKREMARDMVELMRHLGHGQFDILAHDRGARVAHRLVLDHPDVVRNMCLLDIAPTLYMYEHTNMDFAMGYWHWFFLPQAAPLPEGVILGDPEKYWNMLCGRPSHKAVKWKEEDIAEYKSQYLTPEGVHAACEDYRAAATIDLEHDRESISRGVKIGVSRLKVLWGVTGVINKYDDPVQIWRDYSRGEVDVSGKAVQSGHYIPEQAPEELLKELEGFYS